MGPCTWPIAHITSLQCANAAACEAVEGVPVACRVRGPRRSVRRRRPPPLSRSPLACGGSVPL